MKKMSTHRRHDDLTECYAERLPVRLQSGQAESLSRKNVGGRGSRCPRTGRRSDFQVVGSCERPLAFGNLCDAGVQEQWQVTSGERPGTKGEAPRSSLASAAIPRPIQTAGRATRPRPRAKAGPGCPWPRTNSRRSNTRWRSRYLRRCLSAPLCCRW